MKIWILVLITILFECGSPIYASPKTVTISWEMDNTTGVLGYNLYYDRDSSMTNKILITGCDPLIQNPANTFTMTCHNVEIETRCIYYFTVSARMNNGAEYYSNVWKKTYIPAVPVMQFLKTLLLSDE